jgi:hypothetical protein
MEWSIAECMESPEQMSILPLPLHIPLHLKQREGVGSSMRARMVMNDSGVEALFSW